METEQQFVVVARHYGNGFIRAYGTFGSIAAADRWIQRQNKKGLLRREDYNVLIVPLEKEATN